MRTSRVILASLAMGAVAAAACAAAEGELEPPVAPPPPTEVVTSPEASTTEAGPSDVPDGSLPACSEAGWCVTKLPHENLEVADVWVFDDRAFALARSSTLGTKVLEWTENAAEWKYIDDDSVNGPEIGDRVGRLWAPSPNEVFFTVTPNFVFHGKRPSVDGIWTWTRGTVRDERRLAEPDHPNHEHAFLRYAEFADDYPTFGVWGTSSTDVYAWYGNAIFHLEQGDAGEEVWATEYVASDAATAAQHISFTAAASASGDVWFSGARTQPSSCPILVRKTTDGYDRVADCVGESENLGIAGWLTDLQSIGPDELLGAVGTKTILRIGVTPDGQTYALTPVAVRGVGTYGGGLTSLWKSSTDVWGTSFGLIVRSDTLDDPKRYGVSTISRNGAPVDAMIRQIRGSSSTNLWAVGTRHALHKTTP